MIDLHTHTLFSDGELIPSELVRRAAASGYRVIGITDHVDSSNIDTVVPALVKAAKDLNKHSPLKIIPGAEITHVPPVMINSLTIEARKLGAKLVLVHGETIVEPVQEGTNRAAIEAKVDILAHPGLITKEDMLLAKENGVTLEISARKGHSFSNGYVAQNALILGVPLTLNSDAHCACDLITLNSAVRILLSAGIPNDKIENIFKHSEYIVSKLLS
ncbi:PHP domain-containing protein [Candidatus Magnetoovum chiemensis]|nr:PHP domain-containing protein [Candidatus Magnetoovum chiemensis]